MAIHKARDNSAKMILAEPELFVEFLRDFIPVDILKDISPSDVEDISERLLSLIAEQKDGDTIKRINLKNNQPLFVIAIVEHESKVNFRAPFKMLLYIALILNDYEKEVNKEASEKAGKDVKITLTKEFKYPPVLPIIFYDGTDNWTAETNFLNKTEMHEIFYKYIPKFEYELVSLNRYTINDLVQFGDLLSLFMILDKIKNPDELKAVLNAIPKDYIEKLKITVPAHLQELLANVVRVLLAKVNAPQEEINEIAERIYERGVANMFAGLEGYDVQETRREARAEGRAEVERHLKSAIKSLLNRGNTIADIATIVDMTEQEVITLMPELA